MNSTWFARIAARNSVKMVESTLDSIIGQSNPPLYVMVDDGSKDSTPTIVQTIKERNKDVLHMMSFRV